MNKLKQQISEEIRYLRTELRAYNELDRGQFLITRRVDDDTLQVYGDWLGEGIGWQDVLTIPLHLGGAYMFSLDRVTELAEQLNRSFPELSISRLHKTNFWRRRLQTLEQFQTYLCAAVAA